MKNLIIAVLLTFAIPPKGIYTIKIKDIDGGVTQLAKYHGRKLVFMVLSGKEPDSVLDRIAAFCAKYKESTSVIGILSVEDGYDEANRDFLKQLVKTKVPGLILTEGMYTRKSSAGQSELVQWLTSKDQNQRFGAAITGPGWKFLIDETGELYGVLSPYSQLSSPAIERAMNKPLRQAPAHGPSPASSGPQGSPAPRNH